MKQNIGLALLLLFTTLSFAQITPETITRINGRGDFSDKFNSICSDKSGNIYASGYTVVAGNNWDYLLVKISSSGDTLWTRTSAGAGNGVDEVQAMTIDSDNNVYITGYQNGSGTSDDIVTIKYDSNGKLLWRQSYNDKLVNEDEEAVAIIIDNSGNVIITGKGDGDASALSNDNIITIKYTGEGVFLWSQAYTGSGEDKPAGVVADGSGNIYVTGQTYNGTNDDYITIKYSPTGTQEWLKPFDNGKNDRATGIVTDGTNVYVTGRSRYGSNDDYYTIKYLPDGKIGWNQFYDGSGGGTDRATAIAIDGAGVYVTGQSDEDVSAIANYNIVTVKYDFAGKQLWKASYIGTGNGDDIPVKLTVDPSGNVYVTGETDVNTSSLSKNDIVTIKYNSAGASQWSKLYNGNAERNAAPTEILTNASGETFVAGSVRNKGTIKDAVVLKYNADGATGWNYSYKGVGDNMDNANAITVDASGNVYIAGYTVEEDQFRNMCTIKIDSKGDTLWKKSFDGTSSDEDQATAIAVDKSGYVYVTGYSKNSKVSNDITTIKYNSVGDTIWVRKYNNTLANSSDEGVAIALDGSGNIYVTGESESDGTKSNSEDFVTIKYNSSGVQQWVQRFNGAANGSDKPAGLKVGATGVYVTGESSDGTNDDFATIKYSFAGSIVWTKIYNGGNGHDKPSDIILDNSENVIVTGSSKNQSGYYDCFTIKYDSEGTQKWLTRFDGNSAKDNEAKALVADKLGNVIIAGKSANTDGTKDLLTIKYSSMGNLVWKNLYSGSAGLDDEALAIAIDDSANVFVTGQSDNGSVADKDNDFITIKYDSSGAQKWIAKYNGVGNKGSDISEAIAVSGNFLYVTGGSLGAQKDIVVLKYSTLNITGISEIENTLSPIKVYPNPASEVAIFDLRAIKKSENESVMMHLIDALGREFKVSETIDNTMVINTSDYSKGIYFYRIIADHKRVYTGKLIIQ